MGAFEQLFGPVRGEFEQKFSKNSNARGVARRGMLKLRFDWYIMFKLSKYLKRNVASGLVDQRRIIQGVNNKTKFKPQQTMKTEQNQSTYSLQTNHLYPAVVNY